MTLITELEDCFDDDDIELNRHKLSTVAAIINHDFSEVDKLLDDIEELGRLCNKIMAMKKTIDSPQAQSAIATHEWLVKNIRRVNEARKAMKSVIDFQKPYIREELISFYNWSLEVE